jgi:predicted secreted protein
MKKILLTALILTSLLVILTGCNNTQVFNESGDIDTIPEELSVTAGETFIVNLDANETTGYSWSVNIADSDILTLDSNEYEAEETDAVGAGGMTVLTFKANETGETTIELTYSQDWDGGETANDITINVTVE